MEDREPRDINFDALIDLFEQTHTTMQTQAARWVDIALVVRNWLFGWYIMEYQQHGSDRANYGDQLIIKIAKRLNIKGCSERNLASFRRFYQCYSDILQAAPAKSININRPSTDRSFDNETSGDQPTVPVTLIHCLNDRKILQAVTAKLRLRFVLGWTHYVTLLSAKNDERRFYELEAVENGW